MYVFLIFKLIALYQGCSGKENKKPKLNGKPHKRPAKEQTVKPKKKEKKVSRYKLCYSI